MGLIEYVKSLSKAKKNKDHQTAINKISAVEEMISQKFMLVDPVNYQVAMLDNLWNMYDDERLINFCENLKYYCDIQNAYKNVPMKKAANLLISLKYEDESVKPFAYFDNKNVIEYVKNID